jgi:hypothetical protein
MISTKHMSLIACPECNHSVSPLADKCPHCGYALHERQSVLAEPRIVARLPRNSANLKEICQARLAGSNVGDVVEFQINRFTEADVRQVAGSVATSLGLWLAWARMPESGTLRARVFESESRLLTGPPPGLRRPAVREFPIPPADAESLASVARTVRRASRRAARYPTRRRGVAP